MAIVTVERRIGAAPQAVLDAWLDPTQAGRWLFRTDEDGAILTLSHEGIWVDWKDKTRQGWTMILEGLARTLTE